MLLSISTGFFSLEFSIFFLDFFLFFPRISAMSEKNHNHAVKSCNNNSMDNLD